MISLADRLEVDSASVRETRDGYLVASARTARTGIQVYSARELGLTDRAPSAPVRVYRSPEEVFKPEALASMGFRPMTNDHPGEAVTAENWKRLSIGNAGGEVMKDGDFVRVPLVMMDAAAIRDFRAGKRELSWGYTCELKMQDGVTPEGEAFDAIQTDIRANHIALCNRARGGDKLTFGDHEPGENAVLKTILVDGLNVEVTDAAEKAIIKLQGLLADAKAATEAAQTKAGELAGQVAVKDAEIAALGVKLKDAEITPEKLQVMAADRARLETAAKPFLGDAYDFKGKGDADIRRAVVQAKMGDQAKDMADAAVTGAFAVLTSGAAPTTTHDGVREAINGGGLVLADATKLANDARAAMIAALKNPKGDAKAA